MTTAKDVTAYAFTTSTSWAAPYNGFFCIQVVSNTDTQHDVGITCSNIQVASQYFVYKYQKLMAYLPLRKGTGLVITGNADILIVTCMAGVFNP